MADDTPLSAQTCRICGRACNCALPPEGVCANCGHDLDPLSAQELAELRKAIETLVSGTGRPFFIDGNRVVLLEPVNLFRLLATLAAAERERDEALARIARVEALCDHPSRYTLFGDERENFGEMAVLIVDVRTALAATNPSGGAE